MDPRAPGEGRYAQVEREQRWVLRRRPDGLDRPIRVDDRYLEGRLRLRTMTSGIEVVYKLGQKVRPDERDPAVVKLTNMYLSRSEYAALATLPGHDLRKTRWHRPGAGVIVDEFHGHLSGLVLAEVELASEDEWLSGPDGLEAVDVTHDDRFSGGALARLTADGASGLLAAAAVLFDR
jgi:hypothetical protein